MGNSNARNIAAPPHDSAGDPHDEAACEDDAEHDRNLSVWPSRVAVGVEIHSLSMDSLREVTFSLLEINEDVVRVILDCRKDVWKTQELCDLIQEFFNTSGLNLNLVCSMEYLLRRARDCQLQIRCALLQISEGEAEAGGDRYARTLEQLMKFKAAGNPFTEEFFEHSRSTYANQISLLVRLASSKDRLDKKISCYQGWKQVAKLTFTATTAVVQVCSVVADGMGSPPVAAALEAAAEKVGRRDSRGLLTDRVMRSYGKAVRGQSESVKAMETGLRTAMCELEEVRGWVDRLEEEIEAAGDEAEILGKVDGLREKLGVFSKRVDELGMQAERCARDVRLSRTAVLKMVVEIPDRR